MNYQIKWIDLAIEDLNLIKNYIGKDSIINSNLVYLDIFNEVENLIKFPRKGRIIPKIDEDCYRELLIFSYRIMYKIEEKNIYIVAVIHMSREFNKEVLLGRS